MLDVRSHSRSVSSRQDWAWLRAAVICQWLAVLVAIGLSVAAIGRFAVSGIEPNIYSALAPAIFCGFLAFVLQAFRLHHEQTRVQSATRSTITVEQRYARILNSATDLSLLVDADGVISYANARVETLLGRPTWDLAGVNFADLATPDGRVRAGWMVEAARLGYPPRALRIPMRAMTDDVVVIEATARNLLDDPAVRAIVVSGRDVSAEVRLSEERDAARTIDILTGLPNRVTFMSVAGLALARSTRLARPLVVAVLDLDHFRLVNDTFGVEVGDLVLRTVAVRLRHVTPPAGTLCRLNGDRFAVLLEETIGTEAPAILERYRTAVAEPIVVDGQAIPVSMRAGYTEHRGSSLARITDLLSEAESALQAAQRLGPGSNARFVPTMASARNRLHIESELREATERGQFAVYYQPVVSLESGSVVEMEALVRWRHPERGLVSPAEFIPIAEETGLIVPIGWWVLKEACVQGSRWMTARPGQPLTMSVNLSPMMFRQPDLVGRVRSILASTNFPPASLRLEITEGVMIEDPAEASMRLHQLKAMGVQLAIDDFGTGYSSLSYLRHFPVDVIKIDRAFISTMGESRESAAIVRSIIDLARALEMETTGEGIETPHQLATLRELGSDRGQGYLFSRPLPAMDLEQLLMSTDTSTFAA